jgi:hypothetical protein
MNAEEKSKYLIIDGHSIIFHWPDLLAIHSRNSREARQLLIQKLQKLHDTSDWLVTVVFDGKQSKVTMEKIGTMNIVYSHGNETADSIIERLINCVKDKSKAYVVTADNVERITVEALGAMVYTPDWLSGEIDWQDAEWQRTIFAVNKKAKW